MLRDGSVSPFHCTLKRHNAECLLADDGSEGHLVVTGDRRLLSPLFIQHMRPLPLRRIALAWVLVLAASCRNPQADALIAEQMQEMGDALNDARQETAMMHEQIDSLRTMVARQDTLLRQIAGMAGVPVPLR
ncbi:MAG: hypothetical protein ABI664_05260 [bacterium]